MARHIPAVGACKITRPEWPGSALAWPDGVNRAGLAPSVFTQKNTIVCFRILDNRPAKPHPSEELFLQLAGCDIKELRNQPDFSPAHPYISLRRPRAAIPALQAPEMQPRRIPIIIIAAIHNSYFTVKTTPALKKRYKKITNPKSQITNKSQKKQLFNEPNQGRQPFLD
jgi:hypothetical protein